MLNTNELSQLPLAIASTEPALETATAVKEYQVPYTCYSAKDAPIDDIVDGGATTLIETNSVSTLVAFCPDENYYSGAIITNDNPADMASKHELAKVMVAAALALGQPFPLKLDGSDYALVLEAAKICDTNEIPAVLAPAHSNIGPRDMCVAFNDRPAYIVGDTPSSMEEARSAIDHCISNHFNNHSPATSIPPLFPEFGSFTATPLAQTRVNATTPATPASLGFDAIELESTGSPLLIARRRLGQGQLQQPEGTPTTPNRQYMNRQ